MSWGSGPYGATPYGAGVVVEPAEPTTEGFCGRIEALVGTTGKIAVPIGGGTTGGIEALTTVSGRLSDPGDCNEL